MIPCPWVKQWFGENNQPMKRKINERIDEQKENLEDLGGVFVELLLQWTPSWPRCGSQPVFLLTISYLGCCFFGPLLFSAVRRFSQLPASLSLSLFGPYNAFSHPSCAPKRRTWHHVQKTFSFAASCDIAFNQFQLQAHKAGRTHHCKRFLACRRANAIFHQAPAPPHDTNARSNWYHFRLKAVGAQIPVFLFL